MNRNRGINFEPDANGAGRDGFRDGDPDAIPVIAPSEFSSEQANGVQEEIVRAIELLGGTPSYASNEQLGDLLVGLFDGTAERIDPVRRKVTIPARSFQSRTGTWTESSNGEVLTASTNAATIGGPISDFLPDGALFVAIKALIDPGSGNTMTHTLSKRTLDFTTPGAGSQTLVILDHASSGSSIQTITDDSWGGLDEVVSKSAGLAYHYTLTAGNAATNADVFYGVEVEYDDLYPGRR